MNAMIEPRKSVSVVIPTRDGRRTLDRALRSLVPSARWIAEVLLVLSNSPPEMMSFCRTAAIRFREYFEVVVLESGPPSNGAVARNVGIDRACAKYVALLDDDDQWLENRLQIYLGYIGSRSLTGNFVIFSRALSCAEDGSAASLFPPTAYRDGLITEFLLSPFGGAQTSTLMLPAALAKRVRFDEHLLRHQDYDFCIRLEESGAAFVFIDAVLSVWFQNPGGVSKTATFDDCVLWLSRNAHRLSRKAYINYVEKELFRLARNSGSVMRYTEFVRERFTWKEQAASSVRLAARVVRSAVLRLSGERDAKSLLPSFRLSDDSC